MGIFDFFKKASNPQKNIAVSSITDAEIQFLGYCEFKFADLNSFSKTYHHKYGLDYPKTVKKLIDSGNLGYCTPSQSLEAYAANDLKAVLKSEGLPTTGAKNKLIERIRSSNIDLTKHFSRQVYVITPAGHVAISQYEFRKTAELKHRIEKTIEALRTNNYQSLYALYESKAVQNNPIDLGYDQDSIKKDMDALRDYISLRKPSEPEIIMAIVTLTNHSTYDASQQQLIKLGYDFTKEQVGYTHTLLITIRTLRDYRGTNIKKYKIYSVRDGRTCPECLAHHDKIFPISKAVPGKTAPPFCDSCRCIIRPVWEQ